ncbi:hypothetical protein EVJ58_g6666 [Rhodofomes roseus]|uniref:Uncharacterized protein n=1 Tax=Rhodofomes roseus TaxID=34475 RepID=A0A4Y9Y6Q9_9APHY|nr:hypothetical protein EVJ58_g6666 [Rhodofomes roseus]
MFTGLKLGCAALLPVRVVDEGVPGLPRARREEARGAPARRRPLRLLRVACGTRANASRSG